MILRYVTDLHYIYEVIFISIFYMLNMLNMLNMFREKKVSWLVVHNNTHARDVLPFIVTFSTRKAPRSMVR